MRRFVLAASFVSCAAVTAFASFAAPARADCESGTCALVAPKPAVSDREVQSAVDAYLATSQADTSLVGGPGQSGYDGGFWIRGGSFLMKINLTLQARWEWFEWDESSAEPTPGGDLSGYSLPRATLKFSGDATCNTHYYAELEFGHSGLWEDNNPNRGSLNSSLRNESAPIGAGAPIPPGTTGEDFFGILREGWIEYETSPQLAVRMGLVKTAATRQLMTPPEMQQFVDISLASAFIGFHAPGYSDRNRDYGFAVHGAVGCDGEFQYLLTVTNGDGPVRRNVLDGGTSDNFAYSARINWDIKGHIGYEEGALRQTQCGLVASVGAWINYFADSRQHRSFTPFADRAQYGADAAVGYGSWSFTGAFSVLDWQYPGNAEVKGYSYLGQIGFLIPDSAWEIAARYGYYYFDSDFIAPTKYGATEIGGAINYYIDGHADKVTLDASFLAAEEDGNMVADTYAGYSVTGTSDAFLVRLQWQLAL